MAVIIASNSFLLSGIVEANDMYGASLGQCEKIGSDTDEYPYECMGSGGVTYKCKDENGTGKTKS